MCQSTSRYSKKNFQKITQLINTKIPILGTGGITTASDAIEFIIAGASAIATGTANLTQPGCAANIIEGIQKYCTCKKTTVKKLIGSLKEK